MLGKIGSSTPKLGTAPLKPQTKPLDAAQAQEAKEAKKAVESLGQKIGQKLGTDMLDQGVRKVGDGWAAAADFAEAIPDAPEAEADDPDFPSVGAAVDINFAARPSRASSGSGEV